MVAAGSGVVINMASICSSIKAAERRFAYGTTKGAVIGLTKSLAMDFVKHGIKVHCICPGTVDTPSFRYESDFEHLLSRLMTLFAFH